MKKNYNPYTVPEGFFEDNLDRTIRSCKRKSRTLKYIFLSAALAAVLVAIPLFVRQEVGEPHEDNQKCAVNQLARMYDYDIFLQVNF